jgi:tRNA/rRNA methyltransferase
MDRMERILMSDAARLVAICQPVREIPAILNEALKISMSLFHRVRFVLVETSRPGNIGAAARAMKTMGFSELVLVRPRRDDALQEEEAVAFASGAQDILSGATVVETVDEALAGCNFAAAVSARLREYSPPVLTPRGMAAHLAADEGLKAAVVFGNERFGLPNEVVERCNVLINIPANPDYSSLNLAQAVQVLAYECRLASVGDALPDAGVGFRGDSADRAQIDGMYGHLEEALIHLGFLNPASPKKLMPRIKRMFARGGLETEEVNILRGIARQILQAEPGRRGQERNAPGTAEQRKQPSSESAMPHDGQAE